MIGPLLRSRKILARLNRSKRCDNYGCRSLGTLPMEAKLFPGLSGCGIKEAEGVSWS